ncbi:MAG TPA: M56 family metallopeptidase [Terriglobia bacterium]|jgi:uncharacterized protein (TIGR03435 family)
MIGILTNHLWQSTLFAAVAALLTVAFRGNRAQVRYWLWFSASLKFFVPFALLMSVGSHLQWAPAAKKIATPAITFAVEKIAEPFPSAAVTVRPAPGSAMDRDRLVTFSLFGLWMIGFGAIALLRLRAWRRIRAVVRASTPLEITTMAIPPNLQVRSAPGLLEPGVVGWLHPILLLPADITERLTTRQFEAVLAHELCHVQRGDNLTSGIHMIVEAVFWFHPLVWWIGARLVDERERACDEDVLRLGNDALVYADGILQVCKIYLESPLRCISGVSGSNVKKRIQAILAGRVAGELNFAKKAALAAAGMWALAVPLVVGMMHASSWQAITRPATMPKWEAVSIKACKPGERGGRGNRGGGVDRGDTSPERLNISCIPVSGLIHEAYLTFTDGKADPLRNLPIEGGPEWIKSDLYQINGKAETRTTQEMMMGPMLQVLLEDRFNLKIHLETRDVPAYAMRIAKNGPKLQPFKEGSCIPLSSLRDGPPPAFLPGQQPLICGVEAIWSKGQDRILDMYQVSINQFSGVLRRYLNRPVIDETGIGGPFEFHLEFAPDESTPLLLLRPPGEPAPPENEPRGPSIFTAVEEQLGLKLEPIRGPGEFLVIDRIERPSEN